MKKKQLNKLVEEDFAGLDHYSNNYIECILCSNYYINKLTISHYCAHCWSFCFGHTIDLDECSSSDKFFTPKEISTLLKNTYKIHPNSCMNVDCIYNKIKKMENENKLSNRLKKILDLDKNEFTQNSKISNSFTIIKKRDINIDFNLSSINI